MTRTKTIRILIATALALFAWLGFAAGAWAQGPPPIVTDEPDPDPNLPPDIDEYMGGTPTEGVAGLFGASRKTADRTGLGFPGYKALLGRGWERKVVRADRRFSTHLDESAEAATPASRGAIEEFETLLQSRDKLGTKAASQTRQLRVEAALDTSCPELLPLANGYGWSGTARGVYTSTTTERFGRYDLTTSVVIDARFVSRPQMTDNAKYAGDFTADGGEISITRNQVAKDRRTGVSHDVGRTERYTSTLGPLFNPEASFEEFIASQDDGDGSMAPSRPLTTGALGQVARWFVAIPYNALEGEVLKAEAHARTPNACVETEIDAPTHLAPGQSVELTGVPRALQAKAAPGQPLASAGILRGEWINPRGQDTTPLSTMKEIQSGGPWYEFTAPPAEWPDSAPVGVEIELMTAAGISRTPVTFEPEDSNIYFEILDASIETHTAASRPSPFCGEVGGSQSFAGALAPEPLSATDRLTIAGNEVSGGVEASVNAEWYDHELFGCRSTDSGAEDCKTVMPDRTPEPDGTWPMSVYFEESETPGSIDLVWRMDDPEVGFVDAGDAECNAHVAGAFSQEERRRTIERSALQSTDPITLTFAGTGHLDEDIAGDPASIDHTWEYSLTIRRVDEEAGS